MKRRLVRTFSITVVLGSIRHRPWIASQHEASEADSSTPSDFPVPALVAAALASHMMERNSPRVGIAPIVALLTPGHRRPFRCFRAPPFRTEIADGDALSLQSLVLALAEPEALISEADAAACIRGMGTLASVGSRWEPEVDSSSFGLAGIVNSTAAAAHTVEEAGMKERGWLVLGCQTTAYLPAVAEQDIGIAAEARSMAAVEAVDTLAVRSCELAVGSGTAAVQKERSGVMPGTRCQRLRSLSEVEVGVLCPSAFQSPFVHRWLRSVPAACQLAYVGQTRDQGVSNQWRIAVHHVVSVRLGVLEEVRIRS